MESASQLPYSIRCTSQQFCGNDKAATDLDVRSDVIASIEPIEHFNTIFDSTAGAASANDICERTNVRETIRNHIV